MNNIPKLSLEKAGKIRKYQWRERGEREMNSRCIAQHLTLPLLFKNGVGQIFMLMTSSMC